MYENAFNGIERDLRAEEGIANELDYVEQTSWVMFLKYLHDLEVERRDRAELDGDDYTPIIDGEYRWDLWAAPKKNGAFDHDAALVGEDLITFVDRELFPYLAAFRQSAAGPRTIEYKIGEVFTELRNKFRSGYILRDVLEIVDGLSFNTQAERHELSQLYESRIRRMGNAGRNGGEYYTPRPLIRAMIVAPQIGETIYDGAVGSAGFLCEAYDYMRRDDLSASEYETLQTRTFYGQEKKGLAYIIGIMNMVLHGIEAPNLVHTNSLNENVMDIQEKDRHDIVLANPPFGGGERREVQQNFPIRTGETAYLFLQHFIRKLRAGGRAAVVIKNTFLSNTDNASVALRRELLEACELHTILDCPQGTFQGAGVKTVVLFFEKGAPTLDIWFYQLDPGRSMGKTNPLNDDDLTEFVALQRTRATGPNSWTINRADLDEDTFDLSVMNPNVPEAEPLRSPEDIVADMLARNEETAETLENIRGDAVKEGWTETPLGEIAELRGRIGWKGLTAKEYTKSGPRFLSVHSLNYGDYVDFRDAFHISQERYDESPEIMLQRDDILICKDGAGIGKLGVVPEVVEPTTINSSLLLIRPGPKVLPKYLYFCLLSPYFQKIVQSRLEGATTPHLYQRDITTFPVILPPLDEQLRIVAVLDRAFEGLARARAQAEANLQDLGDLRLSILQKTFAGELT